ncbi:PREDICTED: spermatogenesis-associated protein 6 isoform X1 [Colobus angolensis palliatus]|uniref:Spermatogenesis-associated protein 6 N-terminal domain-containing protein n=1 Tax=Colobus angolensis palliatus TaxID=336983 RepID=A0A2K5JS08_COLAP|nr:PREDICTED: spermatogenesis-associated protein 6 isoform X1 [Colobus angolensis palliatus]
MPKVKALQCALALEISSVTCPGVVLKDKEDIYLSICVFGQYKKTQCVPATFPLVFNARMVFEKVFPEAVDPGDVVTQLEYDTAVFELIQLVPPVGETLSTYDENTRDFMFPGPNQMSGHHDSNRQVTMRRISGLRGSSPKLEFSTTSVITECLISSRKCRTQDKFIYHLAPVEKSHGRLQNRTSRSQKKKSKSPERSKYCINAKNYEQPTISSKSHSPSPYTKRRMCELSEDTRRRLAHLNLGPYEFKKETDKPPFVIRHVDPPSPRADTLFGSSGRDCERDGWSRVHNDHSHLGCCRPKDYKVIRTPHGRDFDDSLEKCEEYLSPRSCSKPQHSARTLLVHSAPSTMPKHPPSPVLNRASLRERFHSDWCSPSNCDEIHDRVKNVLKSHQAHQRHLYDERDQRDLEKDDELELKRSLLYRDSAYDSDPEYSSCQQPRGTFHLDDGEYWSNRAASYKGKSHRPIFENSMDKMYRNLYKKACSSASHTQESF